MSNKKMMILAGVAALIGLVAIAGAWAMMGQKKAPAEQAETKKKRVSEPLNVLAVADRPYMQIAPLADGRNLLLLVKDLKKTATEVEYELEYQAGSLLQGAFDTIKLDSIPAQKQILLGSCSAGGACTYHTDVKGGTVLLRFSGPENYALKSEWRYLENKTKETAISSKDAKFQLTSPSLATQKHLVVYNSPGFPKDLTGTPVSDPYSLAASSTLTGKGELSIRANEEGAITIMGWDGTKWQSFTTTMDGKTASATVDLMELYIAVK